MSFTIVIPARYASTRLSGKPLREIANKSLLQHVFECAKKSEASQIIIATDDERIEAEANKFSDNVCMTRSDHQTGTDRLAEVIEKFGFEDDHIIVNLQGDEPLMPACVINQVAENLAKFTAASSSTVCTKITDIDDLEDPNVVKVVRDKLGYALYFSRFNIPFEKEHKQDKQRLINELDHYRHIGLYAYRVGFLKQFVQWPMCPLEKAESLEQLRSLWHGEKIVVDIADEVPGPGVDTEEDLNKVKFILNSA